jgi:cytoskeletal protein CcmA (bactofilin family)
MTIERVVMKKIVSIFAVFTLALSFLWVGVAAAANVRSGQSPHIMSDEVIDGTLYSAGGDIKIEGTVQGDLLCVGQNVDITGTIEGDVLCAGQTVTVSGHVQGDIRVAGQVVNVKGKVDGSVSLVGQNVDIDSAASVARDVTIVGQQLGVAGTVGRDIEAVGTSFTASSKVGRDLDVTAQTVTLSNGTDIAGFFMYVSANNATVDSGAKIAGKTEHKLPPKDAGAQDVMPAMFLSSLIFSFSSFLLIGAALLFVAPRAVRAATNAIQTAPAATLGTGFIALFAPPFLAAVLLVSIIGVPLGAVILLAWIISLILGLLFSAQVIGRKIIVKLGWHDPFRNFASLVLGLFVLFIVSLIPLLGGIVMMLAVVWGMGGLYYAAYTRRETTSVVKGSKKDA